MIFKSRSGEDHMCGQCLTAPKRFGMARSAGLYDRALMTAIHYLKYNGKVKLAQPLGTLLFYTCIRYWDLRRLDLIIPVPLHAKRMRMRGFNQSFLMVRQWPILAAKLNIEIPGTQIDRQALIRKRWAQPQTGLSRSQRLANIRNMFCLSGSTDIIGKKILLVDDVYTTGATVDECAKVLLKGGAAGVDVLTLAQAA
jgi:ComF family protein